MAEKKNSLFAQANSFAMLHGLYFGLLGIVSVALMRLSLQYPLAGMLAYGVVLASPFVAVWLTRRFRDAVMVPAAGFSFARAYIHSLLMGFYSGIIVALAVGVYLMWFDHGVTFDAYEAMLSSPEVVAQMKISGMDKQVALATGGKTLVQVIDEMREVPPADYAASIIYMNLFAAPVVSLIVAAFCRKSPQPGY
ncbi:MAG: DUF4199 domain-containing protein [Bacteroidaceae bacterium]|nr:DUF4199 domain-containing protein [Bacteroidaceae bacterium]